MDLSGSDKYKFLFVVETQSEEHDTDFKYIRKILNDKYNLSKNGHKIEPIYCKGKGKITKQENKINNAIKKYKGTRTFVFICIDTDEPVNSSSWEKNKEIYDYCNNNKFHFVWFKKDVENVIYKTDIPKSEKTKKSLGFCANGLINNELINRMKKKTEEYSFPGNCCSNLILVIENILLQ